MELSESAADRRNKIVRFKSAGKAYAQKIIPPAANAEIDDMGELSGEEMAELVRLTTLFSERMNKRFDDLEGV